MEPATDTEDYPSNAARQDVGADPFHRMHHVYAPAVYRSSATLLSSLFFPPYEFVHCDLDDEPDDDCQITGEYQQYDELSSSSS
ncbi:hypothetical protein M5D96_001867 [Drosophila gunungcola]|uniref:Uncharacterized protein n=1 Tax=Drosophila gunungcola TaxID=103775 RepID=A0A9P9YYZ4_9MUSC|nr:hypothetical protein M5D96_001867 [Drosophila gunungcola]